MVLNSKSEFNRCRIPRLVVEEMDEEALRLEEEREEKEAQDNISGKQEDWERSKTTDRTRERSKIAKKAPMKESKKQEKRRVYTLVEEDWGEEGCATRSSNINKKRKTNLLGEEGFCDPSLTPSPPGELQNGRGGESPTPQSATTIFVASCNAGSGPATLTGNHCQFEGSSKECDDNFEVISNDDYKIMKEESHTMIFGENRSMMITKVIDDLEVCLIDDVMNNITPPGKKM